MRVDDFVGPLSDSPDWTIIVHEKRPRPSGAASAAHHVDDIVLRARRLPHRSRQLRRDRAWLPLP